MNSYEIVGRIGGLSGKEGELTVATYDSFPTDSYKEGPLFVMIDELAVPLFIGSLRRRGRAAATVAFDDIDSPARAAELVGLEILIPRRDREEAQAGTFIGFAATINGKLHGEVIDFIDNSMNPLLEIAVEGKTVYVPAVEEFIVALDSRRRTIALEVPEGLVELYV
ncbi:MAG: 16S rRNA processing protein RimM [Rikenellaceae bacterium]|jgi:16S rRNA processing protein RimM|nr:16S rRNA processing protein RimM [Rikenellaceae bacterium]